MSGKFESLGSGMYSLIREGESGYDESVFGIEHDLGQGLWVYNNDGKPLMDLEELKQFREILDKIIETEENYKKIKSE